MLLRLLIFQNTPDNKRRMNNAANDAPAAVMSVFLLLFPQETSVQSPGLSPTLSKSDPLFDLFNKSDGTEPVSLFFSRFLHRCYQELEPILSI